MELEVKQSEVSDFVFTAPWKTASQYSAYLQNLKKAQKCHVNRSSDSSRYTTLSAKEKTDRALARKQQIQRQRALMEQQQVMRNHAAAVAQQRRPSSTLPIDIRRPTSQNSYFAQQRLPRPASDEPTRQQHPPEEAASTPLPQLLPRPKAASNVRSKAHEEEDPLAPITATARPPKVTSAHHEDSHYIYEDEVGVVDIDDGDSTDSEDCSAAAEEKGATRADDDADFELEDDTEVDPDSASEAAAHSVTVDAIGQALEVAEAERSMTHWTEENEALIGPMCTAELDELFHAMNLMSESRQRSPHRGGRSPQQQQPMCMAVYLASLRPHAVAAIVDIEERRRRNIIRDWSEPFQSLYSTHCRKVHAIHLREVQIERQTTVVLEQEVAHRHHMESKERHAFDTLLQKCAAGERQIARLVKFRRRLDDKEDNVHVDQARELQLMQQMALKLLNQSRATAVERQTSDAVANADNTQRRGSMRRRSTLLLGGGGAVPPLLERRKSVTAKSTDRRRSVVLSEGPTAHSRPATNESHRRSSLWQTEPSFRGAPVSCSGLYGPDSSAADDFHSSSSDSSEGGMGRTGTQSPDKSPSDPSKKHGHHREALDARWKLEAESLAGALKRELLENTKLEYDALYDRLAQSPSPHAGSPGARPPLFDGSFRSGSGPTSRPTSGNRNDSMDSRFLAFAHYELPKSEATSKSTASPQQTTIKTTRGTEVMAVAIQEQHAKMEAHHQEALNKSAPPSKTKKLATAVHDIIQGTIRRGTVFRATAGFPSSLEGSFRGNTSGLARQESDYHLYQPPPHSTYNVDLESSLKAKDAEPDQFNVVRTVEQVLDGSWKQREGSTPVRQSLPEGRRTSLSYASFCVAESVKEPTLATHGSPHPHNSSSSPNGHSLRRRGSGFYRPSVESSMRSTHRSGVGVSLFNGGEDPSMETTLRTREDTTQHNRNPSLAQSGSVADMELRRSLLRSGGGRRSNLASLVVSSGLGRHSVVDTRVDGTGDTRLFRRLRSMAGSSSRGSHRPSTTTRVTPPPNDDEEEGDALGTRPHNDEDGAMMAMVAWRNGANSMEDRVSTPSQRVDRLLDGPNLSFTRRRSRGKLLLKPAAPREEDWNITTDDL